MQVVKHPLGHHFLYFQSFIKLRLCHLEVLLVSHLCRFQSILSKNELLLVALIFPRLILNIHAFGTCIVCVAILYEMVFDSGKHGATWVRILAQQELSGFSGFCRTGEGSKGALQARWQIRKQFWSLRIDKFRAKTIDWGTGGGGHFLTCKFSG